MATLWALPTFDQAQDGFVTSTLSQAIPEASQATMADETGTLDDTVAGYSGTILAGPNHFTTCADVERCDQNGCEHVLAHVTTLSTGFVAEGELAQLVHDEQPLDLLP